MTPHQVFFTGALGGIAGILSLILFVGLALAVHAAVARVIATIDDCKTRRRARREDLVTCKSIYALPTATHPTEDAP